MRLTAGKKTAIQSPSVLPARLYPTQRMKSNLIITCILLIYLDEGSACLFSNRFNGHWSEDWGYVRDGSDSSELLGDPGASAVVASEPLSG